jgi:hypothetical protein
MPASGATTLRGEPRNDALPNAYTVRSWVTRTTERARIGAGESRRGAVALLDSCVIVVVVVGTVVRATWCDEELHDATERATSAPTMSPPAVGTHLTNGRGY